MGISGALIPVTRMTAKSVLGFGWKNGPSTTDPILRFVCPNQSIATAGHGGCDFADRGILYNMAGGNENAVPHVKGAANTTYAIHVLDIEIGYAPRKLLVEHV